MKKPLFNQEERRIIRSEDSHLADKMKSYLALKDFERSFIKSGIGKFAYKVAEACICKYKKFKGKIKYG